jgi:hypothetical protein
VRHRKRQNVLRPNGQDDAVKCDCIRRIAVEPSARGHCMTTRGIAGVWTCCLNRGNARAKRRPRASAFGAHDECGAQTMTEHAAGVVGKQPVDLGGSVATLRQQHVERAFAAALRVRFNGGDRLRCCVKRLVLRQNPHTCSHSQDRRRCPVDPRLPPANRRACASGACMSAHIVGCPGPPMMEAPDFMLETPEPPSRQLSAGAMSLADRRQGVRLCRPV